MSEYQKITSVVRTKDPRRVEAGRRLAAISRQAKERKARERQVGVTVDTADPQESANTTERLGLIVSAVGVVVGAAGVYYAYNNRVEPKPSSQDKQAPKDKQTPTRPALDSLD